MVTQIKHTIQLIDKTVGIVEKATLIGTIVDIINSRPIKTFFNVFLFKPTSSYITPTLHWHFFHNNDRFLFIFPPFLRIADAFTLLLIFALTIFFMYVSKTYTLTLFTFVWRKNEHTLSWYLKKDWHTTTKEKQKECNVKLIRRHKFL